MTGPHLHVEYGQAIAPVTFLQPKTMVQKPHVHRDRWGRPIILTGEMTSKGQPRRTTCTSPECKKAVDGVAYRRATTFIDVLDDRSLLEKWKMRGVARGLAQREGLLYAVAAAGDDDRKVNQLCEEALEAAGTSDAATRGTALHNFTEYHDRGEPFNVPAAARPDIDAYVAATAGMTMREVETFVVNDRLEVAGTFDRLLEIDGVRYIGDIKTGGIEFGLRKIAMQLAVYADSKRYDTATGERSELQVDPNFGLVIHLPAGERRCELVWLDLVEARRALDLARSVWAWRKAGADGLRVGEPPALGSLLAMAGDLNSLNELWAGNAHRWNDQLTEIARRRRAELEAITPNPNGAA